MVSNDPQPDLYYSSLHHRIFKPLKIRVVGIEINCAQCWMSKDSFNAKCGTSWYICNKCVTPWVYNILNSELTTLVMSFLQHPVRNAGCMKLWFFRKNTWCSNPWGIGWVSVPVSTTWSAIRGHPTSPQRHVTWVDFSMKQQTSLEPSENVGTRNTNFGEGSTVLKIWHIFYRFIIKISLPTKTYVNSHAPTGHT